MADHSIQSAAAGAPGTGQPGPDGPARGSAGALQPAVAHLALPDLCTVAALALIVLVGEFLALVLLFAGAEVSWMRFALLSLFVQWVALLSAGGLCWLRPRLAGISLPAGAGLALAMVLSVTLVVGLSADRLLAGDLLVAPVDWQALVGQFVIAGIIAVLALRYFHVQQQLRLQEQAELQSRIQALQSRIRPHFLFNSMNIIASLIETDPVTAESVVEDLAELFRASLNEAGHEVPLVEELALCERYLRIEQLRLGDRLRLEWCVDPVPAGTFIPLLTLQPLLENAIYHGVQPRTQGGTVGVRVAFSGGRVEVEITNPVPDAPERGSGGGPGAGNRMALGNIRDRLAVLHGAAARLESGVRAGVYVTTLSFPARDPGTAVGRAARREGGP
jgi:two-component system, LytTR family, sensor histidine kinase AlgZ